MMRMKKIAKFPTHLVICAALFLNGFAITPAFSATTLEKIREQGRLRCGVRDDMLGFSVVDDKGQRHGLYIDLCKAIAVAVLNDADKFETISIDTRTRFISLANYETDVLVHNTTWTFSRDIAMGIDYAGVVYYDGQGFIAKQDMAKNSFDQLPEKAKICVARSTTSIQNLNEYLKDKTKTYEIVEFNSADAARAGFLRNRCEVFTTDISILGSIRADAPNPDDYVVLDDIISKEPLGLVIRDDDPTWRDIIRWVLYATIEAEEKYISSANIDELLKNSADPAVRYLLGVEPGVGAPLGLDDKWFYRIIKTVGNYAEIFSRNVGEASALKYKRGLNALWRDGGLMYAPPFR